MALLLLAAAACAQAAQAAPSYPTGFSDRVIATGLGAPTGVAWAPDGRMFVAEKDGKLDVVEPGSTTPTQILDISARVNHAGDRGLLSVAVDPNYAVNNYVYLLYTYEIAPLMADGDGPMVSRLERFKVTPTNVATSDKVLLGSYVQGPCPTARNDLDCIPSDDLSHSIGTVRADPDGTLWVGSGDAASFGDVDRLALRTYDEQSMAGKIMHIDRDGKGLAGHPFCKGRSTDTLTDVCAKLHAKGFRNPYRFTLRPGGRGLVVGDVGWNQREELDVVSQGGGSYGWPCYEAGQRTPGYRDWPECQAEYAKEGTANAHIGPNYEYLHPVGNTVIGGPTYTGARYPSSMDGDVFYGDYTAKTIRRLELDDQDRVVDTKDFASGFEGMVGLEQAPNGNMIGVDIGTFNNDGAIREIIYQGREPEAVASATPTSGPTPLTVDFTGSASFDADSQDLTYDWDFGDGSAHSAAVNPRHVYTSTGTYTAKLTVSDRDANSDTATVTIRPGNDAPTATIDQPADGSLYRDGNTIALSGSGSDRQDGALGDSALSWQVLLHHGDHIHPLHQATGKQTSFTAATDHDADSYYEVVLTAKDASGLTGTRSITLKPETTQARITSTPAGAPITYSGRDFTAPLNAATAIGFRTSLSADAKFTRDGRTYYFDRWSDGGAQARNGLTVPASGLDLRAYYREDKAAGQQATASSTEFPDLNANAAVDGSGLTRWSSTFTDGQWWQVDLGSQRKVEEVSLDWSSAYPSQYQIQTSANGSSWSTAATQNITPVAHGDSPGTVTTAFTARTARYVRVLSVQRATEWGVSFWEARVLGPTDATTPETTISSGPSGPTQQRDATWAFTSEVGATFECKLDNASWQTCTSPRSDTGMADGSHTFQVRAVSDAGEDPTPASRTVIVDNAAPDTTISGGPTGTINTRTATLAFTGSESGGTFECKLDNAATWEPCTSPKDLTGLGDGSHTFQVRAKDAAGNIDGSPATRTFSVDATAPDTAFTSGPANGDTTGASASFGFSSEAGATFECKLDNAATWDACTSPKALTGLAGGQHTFQVRAKDANGNVDASPASRTFTVDASTPETTITIPPPATLTSTSTSVSFTSELGATFECKLDSGDWAACTSPKSLTGLAQGQHTFSVRAKDSVGNIEATPETRTFFVDSVAPSTSLTAPTGTITVRTAQVTFASNESGGTFECRLDSAATWELCTSPKDLTGLGDGSHTFQVRAKDAAGNVDASPASQTFTVDATAPGTTLGAAPADLIKTKTASFGFTSDDGAATFECKLDSGDFAACTSPKSLSGLDEGQHSFQVRAKDAAGNVDASPAGKTFTVDTVAPQVTIDTAPPALIGTTTATYAFTSNDGGAAFRCKLDSGSPSGCTSPTTLTGLADGNHTFTVEATDAAGNPGTATGTFRVDASLPETRIDSGPTGTIATSSASFGFTGDRQARFECKLDGGSWATCTSPKDLTALADGDHVFAVRAVTGAGNPDPTPAERRFTVDTRPPVIPTAPTTPAEEPVAPAGSTPSTPKAQTTYASTVMRTRGLNALFGLGDPGRWAVDAEGGRSGKLMGSPRRTNRLTIGGRDGWARAFDGRDDRIDLDPRTLGTPKAFSIETWLRAARRHRTGYLVTAAADRARDGVFLALDARGRPILASAGRARLVGPALGTSLRHLAATFDGHRLRLYVDGKLRQTSGRTGVTWSRKRRLVVGADEKGRNGFSGALDELSLYDRALSATTIKAHRDAGR